MTAPIEVEITTDRQDIVCAGCGAIHPYIPYGYMCTPMAPEDRGPAWFKLAINWLPVFRGKSYCDPRGPSGYVPGCDVWVCSVPCLQVVGEVLQRYAEETRDEYIARRGPTLPGLGGTWEYR